ncbi:14869_t:CDS:2, partial [Acaulospora colombiana]
MSLKDFFGKTNVSEWRCENVVNYYWENVSQYATLRRILYDINSELKQIKQVDSNTLRGRTARMRRDMAKLGHARSTGHERK